MPIADIDFREYLTQDKINEISDVFTKVDSKGTGSLGEKELATMFHNLGRKLSRKQLLEIIHEVDFDGSGGIELDEFFVMNIKLNKIWPHPELINYREYLMDVKIRSIQRAFSAADIPDEDGNPKGWIDETDFVDTVLEKMNSYDKDFEPGEDFVDAVLKQMATACPFNPDGTMRMNFDACCSCVAVLSHARKRINYREFLETSEVEHYRKLFAAHDSNKDMSVSLAELAVMMQRLAFVLTNKQLKSVVKDFDINESGEIDFEEFCVMMCRMGRKRRLRLISPETCTARDLYLEDRFSVKELFLAGFKLEDMKKAGVSLRELRDEGIGALEFRRAGYTPAELRRAGVNLTELRSCGFSLADLRLAGFSDGSVSEANRLLRSSISVGDLGLLPQTKPNSRMIYGTKEALKSLPLNHPLRLMTPLIRGHTDYNVFPDLPKKTSLVSAGNSIVITDAKIQEAVRRDIEGPDDQGE